MVIAAESLSIAIVGLIGSVLVALIGGYFLVRSSATRTTVQDTTTKIQDANQRVQGWELLYTDYRKEVALRSHYEQANVRLEQEVMSLREQLADALAQHVGEAE